MVVQKSTFYLYSLKEVTRQTTMDDEWVLVAAATAVFGHALPRLEPDSDPMACARDFYAMYLLAPDPQDPCGSSEDGFCPDETCAAHTTHASTWHKVDWVMSRIPASTWLCMGGVPKVIAANFDGYVRAFANVARDFEAPMTEALTETLASFHHHHTPPPSCSLSVVE